MNPKTTSAAKFLSISNFKKPDLFSGGDQNYRDGTNGSGSGSESGRGRTASDEEGVC